MTTNFYIPRDHVDGDRVTLPEDEARHASKVLRKRPGDEIVAVDGVGGWYRIVLDHLDKRTAGGRVVERRSGIGEPPFDLTLAVAVVKHRSRFETFLEKAAELGVTTITPVVTHRTERERVREQRSENVLISAMKQCGRSRLPRLTDPVLFGEFLRADRANHAFDVKLICHEGARGESALANVLASGRRVKSVSVLVGPEGGFTDDEITQAVERGYRPVSLGPRRLRAETAAIVASAAVMLAYDR